MMNTKHKKHTITGADLEKWRLSNGFKKGEAADAFGIQRAKWETLISPEQVDKPIKDPVIAMLWFLYQNHPESSPVQKTADLQEFYDFLELQNSPKDRWHFALLIGRSESSVIRLLMNDGIASRQVIRWIEGIKRLKLSPKASRHLMTEVVNQVGQSLDIDNVLINGWGRKVNDEE